MEKKPKLISLLLIFVLAAGIFTSFGALSKPEASDYEPGEVIIGLKNINADVRKAIKDRGGDIRREIKALNAVVVKVPNGQEKNFLRIARNLPGFEYAERNGRVRAVGAAGADWDELAQVDYVPSDPDWDKQWNMRIIEADTAWDIEKGSTSVVIAIVDTGVDYTHSDLSAHYVSGGYDWVNGDGDPMDDNGHGTHCAGIVAAEMDNGVGVAGVSQSGIWAEKVLSSGGSGLWDWVANGITHATDSGVDIISMSLGGYGYSSLLDSACTYAWSNGVLLVAAAGNDGLDMDVYPHYPASFETVVAVSGTDSSDGLYTFTNYGSDIEVSAPGVSVYSTYPGGYAYMTGTSMSTPHVAGVAALALSQDPSLTNSELRNILHLAVDDLGAPGWDEYYGYGRINAYKALTTTPPLPHHFIIEGYTDELWLSLNPDKTLNGYDEAAGSYTAPILGMWGGGGMLLFIDFPTGSGSELMMMTVSFPSLTATGYLTLDGLVVDGPYTYQLVYVPSTDESATSEGEALANSPVSSEVQPRLKGFYLRPYIDEEYFGSFAPGKINGYADVPGSPGYPAPHLGLLAGGRLIFADDYLSEPGLFELRLNIITLGGLTGISYATVDGLTVDGPIDVWLEPMTAEATAHQEILNTAAQTPSG